MGNLTLDQTINNVAQNYATNLARMGRMVHSGNQNYGENLYTSCVYMANLDIQSNLLFPTFIKNIDFIFIYLDSIAAATDIWYNEISKYNYNYPGFSSETGHFTQVVWRTSNKVGFGVAVGTTGLLQCAYVVANYAPPGNYLGQFQQNVVPPLKYQL